jgi:isopenicillin N synthase-like dioxygenase
MCEFVVYVVDDADGRSEVARNIVAARRKDGIVHLMDAFGSVTRVENATIEEANTFSQEMILKKS